MGLFNFLYKLTNIFSNKRKLKIFIVLGIILFLVFSWSRGVFASTPTDDEALMLYQLNLQNNICDEIRKLYEYKKYNTSGFNQSAFDELLSFFVNYQVYVDVFSNNQKINFRINFYMSQNNPPTLFTQDADWNIGLNSGTTYSCKVGLITPSRFTYLVQPFANQDTIQNNFGGTSFYMPSSCYLVRSNSINELLKEFGYMSQIPSTISTSDEELQRINQAGFNTLNSTLQTQTQTMTNSINNASTSITNSVDNLNNTISDTSTDDSQVQLAQDNNQDLTNGFFTGLYNSIQDAFTDNSYKYVKFPIPFTNKNITFSSSYVLNNIKRNEKFSVLVSLAESAWWFGLGYFVLLDIYKKINAIKSGDLTNIENENITTNLL